MLMMYITEQQQKFMNYAEQKYREITSAFLNENAGVLDKAESSLQKQKNILKNARRKETLCLRNLTREMAIEKSTWFYLSNNCCMGMLYNLRRIDEVCKEHVDNNFLPLPASYTAEYEHITAEVGRLFADSYRQSANTSAPLPSCATPNSEAVLRNRLMPSPRLMHRLSDNSPCYAFSYHDYRRAVAAPVSFHIIRIFATAKQALTWKSTKQTPSTATTAISDSRPGIRWSG